MFGTILYISYCAVAIFYVCCGFMLLFWPHFVTHRIHSFFPVLASFKYQRVGNGINLIFLGTLLLCTGKLILLKSIFGFFVALVLSALEVYLGFVFYYFEARDIFQAIIHVVLHFIIVGIVIWFMLNHFSFEITQLKNQATLLIGVQ